MKALVPVLLVLSLLAACGSDSKNVRVPASLGSDPALVKSSSRWSTSVGDGNDGQTTGLVLALDAGQLYAAALNGEVRSLEASTGKQRWQVRLKKRLLSGPTVAGSYVLLGTRDAEVVALNKSNGSVAWTVKLDTEIIAAPAVSGDIVIVRAIDGHSYGLKLLTGERLWLFDRTEPNLTLRGAAAPVVARGRVFMGLDNGRAVALNVDDGQPVWEQVVSAPSGRSELERVTDIDANLVLTPQGLLATSYGGDIALLNPENGDNRWKRSLKSRSGLAANDTQAFASDDDGLVWGFELSTGASSWKQEALKYRALSAPVLFQEQLAVGDFAGYVHWLSPSDGKLLGRTRVGSDPIVSMVSDDTTLYVLNADGRIAALSRK
jgi:outer membrane protein assembly factor BamB